MIKFKFNSFNTVSSIRKIKPEVKILSGFIDNTPTDGNIRVNISGKLYEVSDSSASCINVETVYNRVLKPEVRWIRTGCSGHSQPTNIWSPYKNGTEVRGTFNADNKFEIKQNA